MDLTRFQLLSDCDDLGWGAGMTRYAADTLRFIRIAAVFFCIGKALPIALVMAVEAIS